MRRFRFTLIAVCLVLLYLGYNDSSLTLRNPEPYAIDLATLIEEGAPREWLHVTGGRVNLDAAISTSGQVEIKALLIPLVQHPDDTRFHVLVETRDPALLELLHTYHFRFDNVFAQERFRQEQAHMFHAPREVTGMLAGGLKGSSNRDKLMELAQQVGLDVPDDVIMLSEGKEPPRYRGFFFLAMGLAGLVKAGLMFRTPSAPPTDPMHS
ncbi:hypothetical protein SAMN05660860_02339 [Geoalkalibacter ferrihydriticus]|uniref:Uncharacterized protein n=2 Tax=Geoalkalibacter ferrihydriticus TaxID=392333 RepID=A0A0C2HZ12_9BACT|nr:hypothetical protein [Geoalkalibacter ferrihydriticus]KIH77992.1 hypothetical protein GFER_05170 [Geoalkalibacter ferrihydriticus DSM 17813]SDM33719.1 hypothetical protein SAMN05660860_02339 [Geoalkalibacter ferrihydriticus]